MAKAAKAQAPQVGAVDSDDLATAIAKISDGVTRLQRSGLNHRAICVLLNDHTSVGVTMIDKVLKGLADLKVRYTR